MLFLQFQAQEIPGLCFLSVALTRVVISPYKSLLAYFINDGVIADVGPVPLPTQTKSRQIIGPSQSVSPQNICITDSSYFIRAAGLTLCIFHGFAGKNATLPRNPHLQWVKMPTRIVKKLSLLIDSKVQIGRREEARTSIVSMQSFSNATPWKNTSCLTHMLVSDDISFCFVAVSSPCEHHLKLPAVLIRKKKGT